MAHVYVLEDTMSSRSTGPELLGVYGTVVKAIDACLILGAERTSYQWIEPNILLVDGVYTITETEVQ